MLCAAPGRGRARPRRSAGTWWVTGPEASEVRGPPGLGAGVYAFRVDAVRGHRDPGQLFAVLAGLSDDPAFLGYPYPLLPSTGWSLPGPLLADLRRDLREAFLREGLSEDDVNLVMRDYHLTPNA